MRALIVNDTDEKLPESFIHSWISKTVGLMNQMNLISKDRLKPEVSLVFLKETEAKRLNWTYRGKDYATDILSFETEDPESFGELVFCWSVLQKQAKEHKLTVENELGYMLIHGVLHLLGFDHEAPGSDAEKMLKIQDEIFHKLLVKPKPAKVAEPTKAVAVKASAAKPKKTAVKKKPSAKATAKTKKKK